MRVFAEFQADNVREQPCCQWVTEDERDADADAYDCATCAVATHWRALDEDPVNAEAWRLFSIAVNRFTVDTHTAGVVLERVLDGYSLERVLDLLERFALLYEVLCPPPQPKES